MIDTHLPDIAPSRPPSQEGQSSSQNATSSRNHQDEGAQNFLDLVKQKPEKSDLDGSSHEGEENIAGNEISNTGWTPHFLILTQITQQSEAEKLLAGSMLPIDTQEMADINSDLATTTRSPFHRGKAGELFATTKERMAEAVGKPLSGEGESIEGKTGIQPAQANIKPVTMASAMPSSLKSANAAGQQLLNLSGRHHSSHETLLQQHHPVSGRQDLSHLLVPQQKTTGIFDSGDKIAAKNIPSPATNDVSSSGKIEGVDIIHARKQGDLTILQLQLNPENLGRIEAKLRLDKDQLMVEVSTARAQTARLLAKDQYLLMQTLEKAGFGGEMRLTVGIIDKSSPAMPLAVHANADAQNLSSGHESAQNSREHAEQKSGFSSQSREREESAGQEKSSHATAIEQPGKKSTGRHGYVSGSSHRLIV